MFDALWHGGAGGVVGNYDRDEPALVNSLDPALVVNVPARQYLYRPVKQGTGVCYGLSRSLHNSPIVLKA